MFRELERIIESAKAVKQEKEKELKALNAQLKQVWQDYLAARETGNEAEVDRLAEQYDDIEQKAWLVETAVDECAIAIAEAETGLSALKYLHKIGA